MCCVLWERTLCGMVFGGVRHAHRQRGGLPQGGIANGVGSYEGGSLASAQFFDEFVGDAGGVGGHILKLVFAHAQELALAGLVLVALNFTEERCPAGLFLAVLQLAHHQALHLDEAGAFLAMGGHFEGDGAAHPGADAAGHFGVPDETC